MNLTRLLAVSALMLASLTAAPTMAQEGTAELAARDTWQTSQVLVRSGMKVEVAANATRQAEIFWLFVERTPNGRLRLLVKDTPDGTTKMTFLIQDNVCLGLAGEEVFQPPAPWMLGYYLFGQGLEPAMLLQWVLGLPGRDFSVDAEPAGVAMDKGHPTSIEQAGWRVDYEAWHDVVGGAPAIPSQFLLTGDQVEVRVSQINLDAHTVAPADYSEFKIM